MKSTIKGFVAGVLATTMLTVPMMAFAETTDTIKVIFDRIKLVVNDENVQTPTILYDGTTYVPIRAVAENLGAKVDYEKDTQTAKISLDSKADESTEVVKSANWENGRYNVVESKDAVETDPVSLEITNVTAKTLDFILLDGNGEVVVDGTANISGDEARYDVTDIHTIMFRLENGNIKLMDTKGLTVSSGEATFKKATVDNSKADESVWKVGEYNVVESDDAVETDPVKLEITNVTAENLNFKLLDKNDEVIAGGIATISGDKASFLETDIHIISLNLEDGAIKLVDTKGLTVSSGEAIFKMAE